MKAINFSPKIDLIHQKNDLLVLTNFYSKSLDQNALFKSELIKILNYDVITEISLEVDEGFDTIQGGEFPYIQGKVYIFSKSKGGTNKTLIAEPYIPIKQTRVKNQSVAFQELRQYVINTIHEEFYEALSSIEQESTFKTTNGIKHSSSTSTLFNLRDVLSGKIKYIAYGFIGLSFCYLGLGLYEKKIAVDNQVNSSLNLSMDAKQLTQNDDQAMDKMFKEIGIDRNALSSDLSCFSE